MKLQAVTAINNTQKRVVENQSSYFEPEDRYLPYTPETAPAVGFSICPCKVMMFFSMVLIIFYLRKIANR
jgi:hypothetical protein